ncbi:MAG: hypothetical protein SNJ74_12780 [Fimbriimonadaceae bacterium]
MPMINLIEEQRLALKRAEAKTRLAFFAFVVVLGLAVVGNGALLFVGEVTNAEASRLRAKAQMQKPLTTQIEAAQKVLAEMTPRLTTLQNAQEFTNKWSRILTHLTKQTPENITMSGIRANAADPSKPIAVTFMGTSTKLETVGEFLLRLQLCEDLESIQLRFAQERTTTGPRMIEFETAADIKDTAEQRAKDEKEAEK